MFIDSLGRVYTKQDFEKIRIDKEISLQFIINYLDFDINTRRIAMVLNKYLYKTNEKLLWDLIFLMVPKKNSFYWNISYVGLPKKEEKKEYDESVKKYFGWSDREYRSHTELLKQLPELKEKIAQRYSISNKARKEVGLEEIEITEVDKLEKGTSNQKGLNAWFK